MNVNSKNFNLHLVWLVIIFLCCLHAPAIAQEPVFNVKGSDAKAIKIADKVMKANGGKKKLGCYTLYSMELFRQPHVSMG